jgi:hypothetical protein
MKTLLLILFPSIAFAGVTVSFPSSQIQTDFIAFTTTYWNATVKPGLFAGDYKLAVSSQMAGVPVLVSSPIATATAFDECYVYGFGLGMDVERRTNLSIIDTLKQNVVANGNCGGLSMNTTNFALQNAYTQGCYTAANLIGSTITLRDTLPWFMQP